MANNSLCEIKGCNKPFYARGWCRMHYMRWRRHGDPKKLSSVGNGSIMKFMDQAFLSDSAECILWPFGKSRKGYPRVAINGETRLAHRVMCERKNGPPPSRQHQAAHSCGNAWCVNPSHLRWATQRQNEADKILHGTRKRGEAHTAHLTEHQARKIKTMLSSGLQPKDVASAENIPVLYVYNISQGRSWKWL